MFEYTTMFSVRSQKDSYRISKSFTLKCWPGSHSIARRSFLAQFPSLENVNNSETILILSNTLNYKLSEVLGVLYGNLVILMARLKTDQLLELEKRLSGNSAIIYILLYQI